MKVLVTGAGGVLGAAVAQELAVRGHDVLRGTRRQRDGWVQVDVTKDVVLPPIDAIVHCAADPFGKAAGVEVDGLRRLRQAAPKARIVYPSIVGCDRIRFSYYRVKTRAEAALIEGGGNHAIIRLTQFHEFADRLARLPVPMVFAAMRAQTISAHDAAVAVADALGSGVQGRVADVGGPEVHRMVDLVKARLRADGRRRPVLRLPVGYRGFKAGLNLCPDSRAGTTRWADHIKK